jgi:SAM-dependent methyltransferase/DNA-binding XRE family transcriptional regulator
MSKELGSKIREIRQSQKMSQQAFAESLGYSSRSMICKIEEGKTDMSYDKIRKLISLYNLDVTSFLTPSKDKKSLTKDYQIFNSKAIGKWIENGWVWGKPITHEQYLEAKEGRLPLLLTPTIPMPKDWIKNIKGKKVLGLASGGGQQMPLLSALGAICTVIDITKAQLDSELLVAKREGYHIDIVQGDITKPLPFNDESFDYVINPVSLVYCEKIEPIFKEASRILKKGGVLIGGYDNGLNFITDNEEKEIKNHFPYNPLVNKEQEKEMLDDDAGYEFSHTTIETISAILKAGFVLEDCYQDYNGEGHLDELRIPTFFAIKAFKR